MALLSIGDTTFEVGGPTFDELTHSFSFRWAEQNRLKRVPAQQFLGVGALSKTIAGTIYPTNDSGGSALGVRSLDSLVQAGASGEPQDVISGTGESFGRWVIRNVVVKEPVHFDNGKARKQEFTCEMSYYGEDDENEVSQEALTSHN